MDPRPWREAAFSRIALQREKQWEWSTVSIEGNGASDVDGPVDVRYGVRVPLSQCADRIECVCPGQVASGKSFFRIDCGKEAIMGWDSSR